MKVKIFGLFWVIYAILIRVMEKIFPKLEENKISLRSFIGTLISIFAIIIYQIYENYGQHHVYWKQYFYIKETN